MTRRAIIIARIPRRKPLAMSRAACPFAADIDGQRACAAAFIELHPSGITCLHCPSRRTPPADAAAHLRVIREQPFVSNEQRAAIDLVLEAADKGETDRKTAKQAPTTLDPGANGIPPSPHPKLANSALEMSPQTPPQGERP